MYKIWFSIALGWAFAWRLTILLGAATKIHLVVVGLSIGALPMTYQNMFILASFCLMLYFTPFVLAVYWLLVRGVLQKITKKYSQPPVVTYAAKKINIFEKFFKSKLK